jgi:hypothetical protein
VSGLAVAVTGAVLVLLAIGLAAMWLSRTHTLGHRVGSFRCALGTSEDGPWSGGVAQYGAAQLYWWRRWSLAPRPARRWNRSSFTILERRLHTHQLIPGVRVFLVLCESDGTRFPLLMSAEAYAGLTSWIEATPSRISRVV